MLACAVLAVAQSGCQRAAYRQGEAVRRMHSAESGCPLDRVDAWQIEGRSWVAYGCNVQGAYICDRRYSCRLDGELLR